jgi:myo-inositol 2-dehydrogenase/D-chiro-inositol 1-dehydrogenase
MKIGIAGLNSFYFSQMFTAGLQSISGVEVAGCTTLGVSEKEIQNNGGLSSRQFSEKFRLPVYGTLEELLDKERVEAVCLAARPTIMPGIIKRLAERGIHVFAAKPVAVNEAGLRELESIDAKSAVISAGPTARFDPVIRQAHARVSGQEVGTPTAIRVLHQHGMLKFWPRQSWYYEPEEGGIEHFLAWYCLDLIRWFSGQEIVSIQGAATNTVDSESPHADVLKSICTLSDGAIGSFDVLFNISWPYPSHELEFIGSEGAVRVLQDNYDGHVYSEEGKRSFGRQQQDGLTLELQDWVEACRGERSMGLQLQDLVQLVKASLQLSRSELVQRTNH